MAFLILYCDGFKKYSHVRFHSWFRFTFLLSMSVTIADEIGWKSPFLHGKMAWTGMVVTKDGMGRGGMVGAGLSLYYDWD